MLSSKSLPYCAVVRPSFNFQKGRSSDNNTIISAAGSAGWNRTSGNGVKVHCLNRLATALCFLRRTLHLIYCAILRGSYEYAFTTAHFGETSVVERVSGLEPPRSDRRSEMLPITSHPQMVLATRLELARFSPREPKSSVSANSTTPAFEIEPQDFHL